MSQANKLLTASDFFFFACRVNGGGWERERGREGRKEVKSLFFQLSPFLWTAPQWNEHTQRHIYTCTGLYARGELRVCVRVYVRTYVHVCVHTPVKFQIKLFTGCAAEYRLGALSCTSPKKQASATQMTWLSLLFSFFFFFKRFPAWILSCHQLFVCCLFSQNGLGNCASQEQKL